MAKASGSRAAARASSPSAGRDHVIAFALSCSAKAGAQHVITFGQKDSASAWHAFGGLGWPRLARAERAGAANLAGPGCPRRMKFQQ